MTGEERPGDVPAEGAPPDPEGRVAPGAAGRDGADRLLLWVLSLYAAALLVAAFAQLTDSRTLLDLFDLRRLFTR